MNSDANGDTRLVHEAKAKIGTLSGECQTS